MPTRYEDFDPIEEQVTAPRAAVPAPMSAPVRAPEPEQKTGLFASLLKRSDPMPEPELIEEPDMQGDVPVADTDRINARIANAVRSRSGQPQEVTVATKLGVNPAITAAISDAGYDVCSHGYRWINHRTLTIDDEREQIRAAVESFERTLGYQPPGWYCRYGPSVNTRRLLAEHGGFMYDSDAYNDDLPYWSTVDGTARLVVPYSLTTNDGKLLTMNGAQWAEFITDAIDVLVAEGEERPKMMSIGLHCRIVGQPARFAGLTRVLDHVAATPGIWVAPRIKIAHHWATTHPPQPRPQPDTSA